jgi:AsmA protein
MKRILVVVGIVVGLIIVALAAIPLFIDANQFRPKVESEASAALGREVKVGKIDLSLLRGGVVASDVTIADDPAFSHDPFLNAKSLKIGVEMWPLITSRQVHVTTLTVDQPQIDLVHSTSGKWNFDSLGAKTQQKKGGPPATSGAGQFSVKDLKLKSGRINVVQGNRKYTYEDVHVSVQNLSDKSVFPFLVEAKAPGGGNLKVQGTAGPLNSGDMTATPLDANVTINGLDLAATGFVPAESGLAGILDYQGTVKSDGKKLHSEGKATATKLRVVKTGSPARQPVTLDYASDLDLAQHQGLLTRGDIGIGQAKAAQLTGTFNNKGNAMVLNAHLKGTGMQVNSLEGLLPAFGVVLPQGTQLQGGTVNTDLQIQGPLDRLVTSGPIDVSNAKLGGFNLKSRASGLGQFVGLPSGSDLLIQALKSKLRVAPDGIRADGIDLILPSLGSVTGDGVIGANNSLNFKMKAKLQNGIAGGLMGGASVLSTLGQSKGEIPFLIQGTTSNPIFVPDMGGAVTNSLKSPVQGAQGLGGVLGGFFGKKDKKK